MNVIIVHGGPLTDTPEEPHHLHELYWQPWVKSELEKQGVTCDVPAMPNPWVPNYEAWRDEFEKFQIDEETVLVGHSRGAAFLVRWLGETGINAKKLILVAPNLRSETTDLTISQFYDYEISEAIATQVRKRIVFTSENDDLENIESAQILAKRLDFEVINLPRHGHYITEDMGTDEFPELIDCILN